MGFQTQNKENINNMTPQQMPKGDTVEITAKFLYITPTINRNTGQPMEGTDKNGKAWKKYDVIFNKEGSQQNKVFGVFNDLSGKSLRLNQLVAGTDYKLLYEQGIMQVKANRLFFIGLPQKIVNYPSNAYNSQQPQFNQQTAQNYNAMFKQPVNTTSKETAQSCSLEETQYHNYYGNEYANYQQPLNNNTPLKDGNNLNGVNQAEQDLWDNSNFKTLTQWIKIASESDVFTTKPRAEEVYRILSK